MNEKIRIAFFADILKENHDGAVRTIHQLIHHLDPNRCELLFFCGVAPSNLTFGFGKIVTVRRVVFPGNRDYSLAIPQASIIKVEQALQEFQPDIIHISSPSILGLYAAHYGRSRRIPIISIYHTHFISYIGYYANRSRLLSKVFSTIAQAVYKRLYKSCQRVFVPTQGMLEYLKSYVDADSVLKIWQRGLNLDMFSPEKRKADYWLQHQISGKKIILFVSRLVYEKNIQLLLDLYNGVMSKSQSYHFVIVGDGTAKKYMEENMADALFLGNLSHAELSVVYASSDIFIFPSETETYGNVVFEAMASGLPTVVSPIGGQADILEHLEDGWKVLKNEWTYYAQAIDSIFENEDLRSAIIHHGLEKVKTLSWHHLADTYLKEIEELYLEHRKELLLPAI